jgi:SNF2 family DNA or RNA helicase
METYYFAYYITEKKPILMNDIRRYFNSNYSKDEAKILIAQVEANIHINEWEDLINDSLGDNLKSLILVKMTNVNDMFLRTDNQINDDFIPLISSNIGYRNKYNNRDLSLYKLRNATFSGTQSYNYTISTNLNYIFIEKIFIPIRKLLLYYSDNIHFDSIDNYNSYKFSNSINHIMDGITVNEEYFDLLGIKILTILNGIIKDIPTDNSDDWTNMKAFIALQDESLYPKVSELWQDIQLYNKYDQDPLKFLSDHNMIINNQFNIVMYDKRFNEIEEIYTLKCKTNAKLFVTYKKWNDITYMDAMPYKSFFICNENEHTPNECKHNMLANRIESYENNLISFKNQYNMPEQSIDKKNELTNRMNKINTEITKIIHNLTPVNLYYKTHILHLTELGVRTNFNDYINSYKVIIYMKPILAKSLQLKDLFRFKYETTENRYDDIFKLFISKETLNNILSLNIKVDLFSLSRLFKLTMENKFDDSNYQVTNYKYNSNNELDDCIESIACLNEFLKDNLAVDLIRHQKSNLLWIIKLEDEIDDSKLTITSMKPEFTKVSEYIDNIRPYICSFKNKIPESFIRNYMIDNKGQKLIVELKENAILAKSMSIINHLNADNIRYYGANLLTHYNFDSNIVEKITSFDDYKKNNSIIIPLAGGAICDEVGLGKTLSFISSMVVKMKHDMLKYSHYKSALSDLVCKLDEDLTPDYIDPLEMGFEYNNLIIVPSRLTSQWESEIEKYCKNKFKLNVKVLVGIQAVKNLEKELHDFYQQLANGTVKNAEEYRNAGKKTKKKITPDEIINESIINKYTKASNSKTSNSENAKVVSQKPIIKQEKFNEPNIDINEININTNSAQNENVINQKCTKIKKKVIKNIELQCELNKKTQNEKINNANKKTKETKIIERLMKQAKKQQKISIDHNSNDHSYSNINHEINIKQNIKQINPVTNTNKVNKETKIEITLDNILNPHDIEYNPSSQKEKKENKDNNESSNYDDTEIKNKNLQTNSNPNLNPKEDSFKYIFPYLKCEETGEDYHRDQLYDVYIVSINLLSNENYLDYINHNQFNHLRPFIDCSNEKASKIYMAERILNNFTDGRKICRVTDKFNIFRIKWNRINLDEAHEKLAPIVKYFSTSLNNFINNTKRISYEEQFLFENLVTLKANYKWAMTGTPTQNGIDNIMGILQFLTKNPFIESYDAKIQKVRYFANLLGVTSEGLNTCLQQIFKKTLKKDVKALLNIPLFTEEIIYVDQTNIERNIYNTIRASRHFTEAVKIKRLFLMCTNILINEGYDFDSNSDIPANTEILTLEQLNANMISRFTEQLKLIAINESKFNLTIESLDKRRSQWQSIVNYIQTLGLESKIEKNILAEIKNCFDFENKHGARGHVELVYKLLDIFNAYQEPESAGMIVYMNYYSIRQELERYWKASWETENTMTWVTEQGALLGSIKCSEEIARTQSKITSMQNDKKRINNQIALFSNNEFLKEKTADPCIICFEDLQDVVVTNCRHIFCLTCTKQLSNDLKNNFSCPECRTPVQCDTLNITTVEIINGQSKETTNEPSPSKEVKNIKDLTKLEKEFGAEWRATCTNKYGSKMTRLVEYLHNLFDASSQNRVIIFSQYDKMLKMIGKTLDEFQIKYVYCHGNNYVLNKNINRFKKDDSIRVIMLSSETSNSGSNLTEANIIVLIEPLYHELQQVKAIEQQIIGRAVRLGQKLPVKVIRFITRNTIENEHFEKNRYDLNTLQE